MIIMNQISNYKPYAFIPSRKQQEDGGEYTFEKALTSAENKFSTSKLNFCLEKDGEIIVANLETMPHLFIADSDWGFNNALRTILSSFLAITSPKDLKLLPIGSIMNFYYLKDVPHLLCPLESTTWNDGIEPLGCALKELRKRQTIINEARADNLSGYNAQIESSTTSKNKLPRIIIAIDLSYEHNYIDVQEAIVELLANGAKVGIHMIIGVDSSKSYFLDQSNTKTKGGYKYMVNVVNSLKQYFSTMFLGLKISKEVFGDISVTSNSNEWSQDFLVDEFVYSHSGKDPFHIIIPYLDAKVARDMYAFLAEQAIVDYSEDFYSLVKLKKGIFWVRARVSEDHTMHYAGLLGIYLDCDADGQFSESNYIYDAPPDVDKREEFNSLFGDGYHDELIWKEYFKNDRYKKWGLESYSFEYFPRGKVNIENGKAIISIHPSLNTKEFINLIIAKYGLTKHNGIREVSIIEETFSCELLDE
jgi:hypothetical protein